MPIYFKHGTIACEDWYCSYSTSPLSRAHIWSYITVGYTEARIPRTHSNRIITSLGCIATHPLNPDSYYNQCQIITLYNHSYRSMWLCFEYMGHLHIWQIRTSTISPQEHRDSDAEHPINLRPWHHCYCLIYNMIRPTITKHSPTRANKVHPSPPHLSLIPDNYLCHPESRIPSINNTRTILHITSLYSRPSRIIHYITSQTWISPAHLLVMPKANTRAALLKTTSPNTCQYTSSMAQSHTKTDIAHTARHRCLRHTSDPISLWVTLRLGYRAHTPIVSSPH